MGYGTIRVEGRCTLTICPSPRGPRVRAGCGVPYVPDGPGSWSLDLLAAPFRSRATSVIGAIKDGGAALTAARKSRSFESIQTRVETASVRVVGGVVFLRWRG